MNINTTANSYTSAPDYSNYSVKTSQSASVTQTAASNQELTRQSACQTSSQSAYKSDSTSFPASSPLAKLAEYTKVIDEHYAKVNAENKRFANPEKQIQ